MKKLFFSASNDALKQVTDIYDFVWPTASAMWNFRWQVKGFINEVGTQNITDQNLLDRFDWGSGIHGVNIKRAVLEKSWEEQQEQFARFLLVNQIAIYEGWIDGVKSVLNFSRRVASNLQFPSDDNNNEYPGVSWVISQLTATKSSLLANAFYQELLGHKKNTLRQLENLLICYRFFKECRNCFIHRGGIADQKAYNSFVAFSDIATLTNLDVKQVPLHFPLVVGEKVKLSLSGVVGLGDIIIKLVATLDAELAICTQAENELILRLRNWSLSKSGKSKSSFKKDPIARSKQISRILRSLEFPDPARTDEIEELLLQKGIMRKNYD